MPIFAAVIPIFKAVADIAIVQTQTARTAVTSAVTTAGEYLAVARNVFKAGEVGATARQAVQDAVVAQVTKPITHAREAFSDAGQFKKEMLEYGREKVRQFAGRKVENQVTDDSRDSGAVAGVAAGKSLSVYCRNPKLSGWVKSDNRVAKGSKFVCGDRMKELMTNLLEKLGLGSSVANNIVSGLGKISNAAGVGIFTAIMSEAMQDGDGPLAYGIQAMYGALSGGNNAAEAMMQAQMLNATMGVAARA